LAVESETVKYDHNLAAELTLAILLLHHYWRRSSLRDEN